MTSAASNFHLVAAPVAESTPTNRNKPGENTGASSYILVARQFLVTVIHSFRTDTHVDPIGRKAIRELLPRIAWALSHPLFLQALVHEMKRCFRIGARENPDCPVLSVAILSSEALEFLVEECWNVLFLGKAPQEIGTAECSRERYCDQYQLSATGNLLKALSLRSGKRALQHLAIMTILAKRGFSARIVHWPKLD